VNNLKNILIVIPARGGSKGIPRKNLRLLKNKPLIFYSIKTSLSIKYTADVYVSSDDDEILNIASKFGAKTHKRDSIIANDTTTLDPVIYSCYDYTKKHENKKYDYVITIQPTSPLLKVTSLEEAIDRILLNPDIETMIAVKEDTHLSWREENGQFIPNYEKRVNRQYLVPNFKETGGFFITRGDIISENNRIGQHVDLYVLSSHESIDIDTYEDWSLCEYYLKRKHILFVVAGNSNIGLGHVYNTLLIANDILNHRITFLVDKKSTLAYEKIASRNYPVEIQKKNDIIEDIKALEPDIVVNDCLDTSFDYTQQLKTLNYKVVNFEDLGTGTKNSDLVVNAIYPEKEIIPNHYYGHDYFVLRDEFIYCPNKTDFSSVKEVLITFGGVDPNNYTKKTVESIYTYCKDNSIRITVIAGFGYEQYKTLEEYSNIAIEKNVVDISKYMLRADLIFTSAGRTTYEIASIGTPAIVLAQNEREMTHFFASTEFGFLNLGLGYQVSNETLFQNFITLVKSQETRKYMNQLMKKVNLLEGRKKVVKLIQTLIEE
jgi:CMP-N-acetylneuraminic acid synthetase/spore coat polysaccharide biosynthesis predicted glycosyltransferase SpsG